MRTFLPALALAAFLPLAAQAAIPVVSDAPTTALNTTAVEIVQLKPVVIESKSGARRPGVRIVVQDLDGRGNRVDGPFTTVFQDAAPELWVHEIVLLIRDANGHVRVSA